MPIASPDGADPLGAGWRIGVRTVRF